MRGANLTITATHSAANGGDGFVNIGYIDATDVSLGDVKVDGDLGCIDAGTKSLGGVALKSLSVQSMGRYGTQTGAPDMKTDIDGPLGKLTVKTDLKEVYIHVNDTESGNVQGTIGSVVLGGSLLGTGTGNNGIIEGSGNIGSVTIAGSVVGGAASGSGTVFSQKQLGTVKIGGDLRGGTSDYAGYIRGSDGITSLTIAGSVYGGTAVNAGAITSDGTIAAVTINGSIYGGSDTFTGAVVSNGTIGSVLVKGSITGDAAHPVTISAKGLVNPLTEVKALAIKSVTVNGSVEYTQILAGHDFDTNATNADVQIGAIKVLGDWIASSAVAGAKATNGKFGDADDALIAGGNAIVSKIAKITIGGMAYGTVGGTDSFGFVAQKISAISVGGVALAVSDATPNQTVKVGWTNDLFVKEV